MGNLYPARGSDRDCVVFVKQVHFSYSESPRTPPIEWTSLHWRTYNVDLEPVYDLHPITNSPCQRLWHRHKVSSFFFSFLLIFAFFLSFFLHFFILLHFFFFCSFFLLFSFLFQVIFLTVNHRGPLPLRELHSTGETIVWRDPGGSWACLWPVSNYEWINSPSQRLWHRYNVSSSSSFFLLFFSFFFMVLSKQVSWKESISFHTHWNKCKTNLYPFLLSMSVSRTGKSFLKIQRGGTAVSFPLSSLLLTLSQIWLQVRIKMEFSTPRHHH